MLAFCPHCWNEITHSPAVCRKCGTAIDVYSHEYEKQLLGLIPHGSAAKRAEICLVLGRREKRSAVPELLALFRGDPDDLVRAAALRALSEIGDAAALPEISKVAANEKSPLHPVAN